MTFPIADRPAKWNLLQFQDHDARTMSWYLQYVTHGQSHNQRENATNKGLIPPSRNCSAAYRHRPVHKAGLNCWRPWPP